MNRDNCKLVVCIIILSYLVWANWSSSEPQWLYYNPPGARDGSMLEGIETRLNDFGTKNIDDCDMVGKAHEGTHYINSQLRCSNDPAVLGDNAVYVGEGRYLLFKEPNLLLSNVLPYVRPDLRKNIRTIMETWEQWDEQPMYILDEWCAYVNGSQAANEGKADAGRTRGSHQRSIWCGEVADALITAIDQHDSSYAQLDELRDFIAWQKARMQQIVGASNLEFSQP
jgi:hypothetical protein